MLLKIIKLNFIFLLFFNMLFAQIINDVTVTGNKRISSRTIEIFSELEFGKNYSDDDLNKIFQKLYDTNFFNEINIIVKNNSLVIDVLENPIIEDIELNGIRSKDLTEAIMELMKLKNRNSFTETLALDDLNLIKKALTQNGYYFAEVDFKIFKNEDQNTIRLTYDVNLGDRGRIKKISFLGNKIFKDKNLRSIIASDEHKFWKFVSNNVYVDKNRINLDQRLLLNFYKDNGYYQAVINDSFVELKDDKTFKLIFNIEAGEIFKFNDFEINIPKNYNPLYFESLKDIFKKLKNKNYSYSDTKKILEEIEKISIRKNYEFISAEIEEEVIVGNKINFTINVSEGEKFYVERINIKGNFSTQEEVIRNLLIVDEGDPFNDVLFEKSLNKIRGTNFFKKVEKKLSPGSKKDYKTVDIIVEEQPTGELSLGAGVGTSGTTISGGISEGNFLGKGINLFTNLSISEQSIKGQFTYSKPNFNYTDNTLFTSVKNISTDALTESGYKTNTTSLALGTSFEQYENLFFGPELSYSHESLETNSSASTNLKKQEGDYSDLYLNYYLNYDLRNSPYKPSDGYITKFSQELPVISDGSEFINTFEIKKYQKLISGMVGSLSFYGKVASTLDGTDVRVSKRLSLPANKLRGFEQSKIGPVDGNEFVGGNYASAVNFAATLPQILPTLQNLDFGFFIDVANVWGVDYDSSVKDSNQIRSSTGIGLNILTPVGPLNFSFSKAITKVSSDKTEFFRFNLGTSF
jgi:outer membrane protein insertion porin family